MSFRRKYRRNRFKRRRLARIYRRRNRSYKRKNYRTGRQIGRIWNRIRKTEVYKRRLDFLNGTAIDNIGLIGFPTNIALGPEIDERVNRVIKMHSIEFYGQLNMRNTVTTTQVFMCLVRINGDYEPAQITIDEFKQKIWNYNNEADEPFSWFRPRVLNNMKEFRIVWKKWYSLKETNPIIKLRLRIKCNLRRITYGATDETGAVKTGGYFWFWQSDKSTENQRPQVYGTEIVRYLDS